MLVSRDRNTTPQPLEQQLVQPVQNERAPEQQFQPRPAIIEADFFTPGAEVSRVGMRMPEFTPADPELWFSIVDRSFQAAGITVDATKFGYALTAIGPRYTVEVRDVIMNPPAENAYETLKAELIKRLSLSQEHKTRRLLEHEEIGDRKPSQFLRHLRSLAGSVVGDGVLRTIWLSRLPAYIQPHLVTRTRDAVDQLADIADAIVEATRAPAFQVAETARPAAPQTMNPEVAATEAKFSLQIAQLRLSMQQEMAEQLTAIRKSIEALHDTRHDENRYGRDRRRDNRRPHQRPRSRSRSRGHPSNGLCWYHWRFGPEATRCDAPCSAQQSGNATALR
ncbi:PREDICTED: uncharacterized protein LOC105449544 [Wasmannia auropunctata]|uniref:uncharacterized protein LOC105449544 n=1 Tax=Wasmannia auropunctata TaxID=64793 RepID=UPI0005EE7C57|nr:PREDICTED: uncharacterized protein LOC105449544 [Wasmannia auropunctata]